MVIEYTREELKTAYSRFLWAQGLIEFVLRAGFDLTSNPAEMEGSLISIFSILNEYIKPAQSILDDLDIGHTIKIKPEVIEPVGAVTESK